ncbi:diaminopimelate decarboxylase [Kitasatospora sp. NPDC093102]|uniref:diaminopimelate decarboxylase n=1 Tax=Kitasatospora sp. NPDC093102 TaxID=3155069 RepID=UPI00344841A0
MSRSAHPAGPRHGDVLPEGHYQAPPADLNALDPKVWSRTVARNTEGVATVGGVDVKRLAAEFGTPAYVLDEEDFRARARAWRDAFGTDADVYYAGKAFLSKAVVRWLHEEGLNLDVCSAGELAVALAAGMPPQRIALHGNNKSVDELEHAVKTGVGHIVVDSYAEIERLAAIAARQGVRQQVLIRITVGVEAHTHEFIATAHEDQKFGLSLSLAAPRSGSVEGDGGRREGGGAAAEAVRRVLGHDSLELRGIHSHIGSQIFDMAGFEVAARRVVGLLGQIRDEHGVELPEIDLGGGLGIAYTSEDDPREPAEIAAALADIVRRECAAANLNAPRLSVEPGRAIVGPTAFTLYEVGTVKPLEGLRTYVSVDGGMSDNIRTALYDAEYSVALVSRTSDAEPMLVRVVGKHCESGDIVVRDAFLPADLAPGDLIAVPATGAYCRSMASNYNHALKPPVLAVRDGAARVIVRRETEEDLLRLDIG